MPSVKKVQFGSHEWLNAEPYSYSPTCSIPKLQSPMLQWCVAHFRSSRNFSVVLPHNIH